jgi:hypothetical protein
MQRPEIYIITRKIVLLFNNLFSKILIDPQDYTVRLNNQSRILFVIFSSIYRRQWTVLCLHRWKGVFRLNIPKDDGSEKDAWTQKRFNTNIVNIEESNPGYLFDWDESKLKGKIVGALFNNKEYLFNGRTGFFTNCHSFVTAETIRSGKFTVPADTLLKSRPANAAPVDANGFMSIPDGVDEELPF